MSIENNTFAILQTKTDIENDHKPDYLCLTLE